MLRILAENSLSSANWYDLNYDEQWTKLLNDISRTCETPRVPFMVEDLPENFVQRPGEFDALVSLLRDPKREEPIAMTAALRGAGGFGKTTLARALCQDDRIQEAFDDGILWVTLGETPGDLKLKVLDLVEVLSGEHPGFDTVEAASTRLAELLVDRDILLVIDDVWDAGHLSPFLRDPPRKEQRRCARLITTRNRDALPTQARAVDVDAMRHNEAVDLLGAGLPASPKAELAALAGRLGEWPVLLKLANGVLRDRVEAKEEIGEAFKFVNTDLDENGLSTFDKRFDPTDPKQRDRAVAATLGISLKRLDETDRARYQELAVFPEDVHIPLSTLESLWGKTGGLSRVKMQKLCERLSNLSLLVRFDLATRTILLHDVMRSYLAGEVKDSEALHSTLVDAWDDPLNLPDEYAWRWYAWHLKQARQEEALRKLLIDFNWMRAKLDATDINAVISDYDYVAAAAFEQADRPLPGVPIGIPPWRYLAPGSSLPPPHSLRARGETTPRQGRQLRDRTPGRVTPAEGLLGLVRSALRLSAHVLARDKTQLASQLFGRFAAHPSHEIQALLDQGQRSQVRTWLKANTSSLAPPDGPLLRTLEGHSKTVTAVAVTPDGEWAISASDDKTLKVWDLKTGRVVWTLEGHSHHVRAVAVTPGGECAISASDDETLKVWDLKTGKAVRTLVGHSRQINGVAVTPDGEWAISASDDKTLKVWDLKTGKAALTLEGPSGFWTVAVTPDGGHAVSGSDDNDLKVWDLKTGRAVQTLKGHGRQVLAVAVAPGGGQAISASSDGTLKVWDLKMSQMRTAVRRLQGHRGAVFGVAVTPDGKRAISASTDRTLKVWDLKTGRVVRTLQGHVDKVLAVAVTPEGGEAISASSDESLKVWDLKTGKALRMMEGHSDPVCGVAVTPDGKRAISTSLDETLKVWDLKTGREVLTVRNLLSPLRGVAVTPDGKFAISASRDRTLWVWHLKTGKTVQRLKGHTGPVYGVAVTPDGKQAISASEDGTLKVWDLKTGQALRALEGHRDTVCAVVVTPQGKVVISASMDSTLKVWDLNSGRCVATFTTDVPIYSCAVAQDGVTIVAGDASGTVHFLTLELLGDSPDSGRDLPTTGLGPTT